MKLVSVSVSMGKEVPYMDKTVTTGIFKEPVRDWSFNKPFDESRMVMPSGAVLDTSSPSRPVETVK